MYIIHGCLFQPMPVPWKAVWTSLPVWAIIVAHTCGNWGWYMLLVKLPTYMRYILHFDIKSVSIVLNIRDNFTSRIWVDGVLFYLHGFKYKVLYPYKFIVVFTICNDDTCLLYVCRYNN